MVIEARGRLILGVVAAACLAGCTPHVERETMDTGRLVGKADPALRLACPYRLLDVVDARSGGDRVGGLGNRMFIFNDAPGLVRKQLAQAGFAATADAPAVTVRILKVYLSQNTITKIPVVVYDVQVDQQASFVVRSQLASMNWASGQDEAYDAYARAFQDANAQLVARLGKQCGARH